MRYVAPRQKSVALETQFMMILDVLSLCLNDTTPETGAWFLGPKAENLQVFKVTTDHFCAIVTGTKRFISPVSYVYLPS